MTNDNSKKLSVRRGAIGVIARGDEYLLVRRAADVAKGGYWCFPGGHVEIGETPRAAVIRELREELGIEVEPELRLGSLRVLDTRHILAVWRVVHVSGEFQPAAHEIAEVRWLRISEIRELSLSLASNEHVLKMLERPASIGCGIDS